MRQKGVITSRQTKAFRSSEKLCSWVSGQHITLIDITIGVPLLYMSSCVMCFPCMPD